MTRHIAILISRRVPLIEQESYYPSGTHEFTTIFSWVLITQSIVLCVSFIGHCNLVAILKHL
jgi:hypothetical protein